MEYALPLTMFAGSTMQGLNQASASRAQAHVLDAQQDAALQEASLTQATAERNAQIVRRQYRDKARILNRQQAEEMGREELLFGSSGASGGSAMESLMSTAARHEANLQALEYTGEVDEQNVLWEGQTRAWALNRQAGLYGMQANSIRAGINPALMGSFLEGGAKSWMAYNALKTPGLTPSANRPETVGSGTRWLSNRSTGFYH